MSSCPALMLAEKHLWSATSTDVAVHPEIHWEALNTTIAFLGAGVDPRRGEQVVACSVSPPSAALGTSNTWLLTTHRLRIMEGTGLVEVHFEQLERVSYRKGALGASVLVRAGGEDRDLTLDEPLRFFAFFQALLALEPADRVPDESIQLPHTEPRIAVLRAVIEAQRAAGRFDNAEEARRLARVQLLESTLFHGRPMVDGRWLSPLDHADLVAVAPRFASEPERDREEGDATVYTMGASPPSQVAESSTSGIERAGTLGEWWKADRWKPPSLHVDEIAKVELHVHEAECGCHFRYRVPSVQGAVDLYEAEVGAVPHALDDLGYEEARVLLLRWTLDEQAPVAELMQRSPDEVAAAFEEFDIDGDATVFYQDRFSAWAWTDRLDDHLAESDRAERAAHRLAVAVAPPAPPPAAPAAIDPMTVGSMYGRLAGLVQITNAFFTALVVVPSVWLIVMALLVQANSTWLPALSFLVLLIWPLVIIEGLCGLAALVAPTRLGAAVHLGQLVEVLAIPLGAVHGLMVAGVVWMLRWTQLIKRSAALDEAEDDAIAAA